MCHDQALGTQSKRPSLGSKCVASIADTSQSASTLGGGPIPTSHTESTQKKMVGRSGFEPPTSAV
jgi:hypothetical protein